MQEIGLEDDLPGPPASPIEKPTHTAAAVSGPLEERRGKDGGRRHGHLCVSIIHDVAAAYAAILSGRARPNAYFRRTSPHISAMSGGTALATWVKRGTSRAR